MTLDEKLKEADYRPTGFDYLRIILACAVVFWHTIVTSYGNAVQDAVQASGWRSVVALILPMFFALSGFLVAGSLDRCKTLVSFLGLRLIRIYPALMVEVLLSAFVLGPLLTTTPLAEYFTDKKFLTYLFNVIGHIHYELPGVFQSNPYPNRVNGQLWTVPFELYCYASIAILAAIGLAKRTGLFSLAVLGLGVLLTAALAYKNFKEGGGAPANVSGYQLVIAFLIGIAFYKLRDKIRWDWRIAAGCMVAGMALLQFPIVGDAVAIPLLVYVTVFLGAANPKKIALLRGADYSYGIFLYGYVIQQAWMTLGPPVHHWYINVALALPTAALFAAFSWHVVEKPALKLRTPLMKLEGWWMKVRPYGKPAPAPQA